MNEIERGGYCVRGFGLYKYCDLGLGVALQDSETFFYLKLDGFHSLYLAFVLICIVKQIQNIHLPFSYHVLDATSYTSYDEKGITLTLSGGFMRHPDG